MSCLTQVLKNGKIKKKLTKEDKGCHCVDDVCADVNQVIFTLQTAKIIGISRMRESIINTCIYVVIGHNRLNCDLLQQTDYEVRDYNTLRTHSHTHIDNKSLPVIESMID